MLVELFKNNNTEGLENIEYTKSLLNKYPYFSALYSVLAKSLHNDISKEKALELAAIYSPNRVALKNIITGIVDIESMQNDCKFEHMSFSKVSLIINNKKIPQEALLEECHASGTSLYIDDSIYPDSIISESLAIIMEKQEKFQLAKKIYNRLIKKFPEKKSYFIHKINKLT